MAQVFFVRVRRYRFTMRAKFCSKYMLAFGIFPICRTLDLHFWVDYYDYGSWFVGPGKLIDLCDIY